LEEYEVMNMEKVNLSKISVVKTASVSESTTSTTKIAVGDAVSSLKTRHIWMIETHSTASTGGGLVLYQGDASSYTRGTLANLGVPAKHNGPSVLPHSPDPTVSVLQLSPYKSGSATVGTQLYAAYVGLAAEVTIW